MTPQYRVKSMSRGQIVISDGKRELTIEGEVLPFAKKGDPSYVLYSNSLHSWATGSGMEPVTDDERRAVITLIKDWATPKMTIVVE